MRKYLSDRDLIPAGRLSEVCFDDFEAWPLEVMQTVYRELGQDGFENAKPAISAVIAGTSDYWKNPCRIDADSVRRITEHWRFGFDAVGYRLEEWEAQTISVP